MVLKDKNGNDQHGKETDRPQLTTISRIKEDKNGNDKHGEETDRP